MTDFLTNKQRSELMSQIRSTGTKPELQVRRLLHGRGFRFRLHRRDLPGKPDIVLRKYRTVVFVHGCFWHGHTECDKGTRRPKTNVEFWKKKLDSNIKRHNVVERQLEQLGWNVITVWECETRKPDDLIERLTVEIRGKKSMTAPGVAL